MHSNDFFAVPAGWVLHHSPEVTSTNDLARDAGERGAPERSLFVADHQTRGRGRMERVWLEKPGGSLLFSILFRRHLSQTFLLTMVCSVAACEGIEQVAGVGVEIKWPNDLMVRGRKVAGVLAEAVWLPENPFAVVGMGINVNFDPAEVAGIPDTATSLLREAGRDVSRQDLLHELLRRLDVLMSLEPEVLEREVRARWGSRLWRRRQKVVVAEDGRVLEGVFEAVAQDGALLLRLADGSIQTVRAGDLQI